MKFPRLNKLQLFTFVLMPLCCLGYWYAFEYSHYGPDDEVPIYVCSKQRSPKITVSGEKTRAFDSKLNCLEAVQFNVPKKYLGSSYNREDIHYNFPGFDFTVYHGSIEDGQYNIKYSNPEFQSVTIFLNAIVRRDQNKDMGIPMRDKPDFAEKQYGRYKVLEIRRPHSLISKSGEKIEFEAISIESDLNEQDYYFSSSGSTCQTIPNTLKRCRFRDDYQQYEFPFIELWWTINPHYFERFPEYRERIINLVESFYRTETGKVRVVDFQKILADSKQ